MAPVRVAVASGKGGTGKTLVATNLAVHLRRSGRDVTLVDCDVDAPNAAVFLDVPFVSTPVTVDVPHEPAAGTCPAGCTACRDACGFGALPLLGGSPVVFADLCHHCGLCARACPLGALTMLPAPVGRVRVGTTREGVRLVVGELTVGLAEAPAVVRAARERAEATARDVVLLDAPPGTACAVVATLHDVDLAVLVTDPTVFGLHDLRLMVELCRRMAVPAVVVVNRTGTGDADVAGFCRAEGLPVVAHLPFDRAVAAAYADGDLVLDRHPDAAEWLSDLWSKAAAHAPALASAVPA